MKVYNRISALTLLFCLTSETHVDMPQVATPWVEAVYSAVQHDLLMAVLLENLYEPGRLCPPAEPLIPVGQPLPVPGQIGALGVDRTLAPMWQVTIDVPVIEVAVLSVAGASSAPGHGPPLAQVGIWLCLWNFTEVSHCLPLNPWLTSCSATLTGQDPIPLCRHIL